jgi:hypothetical protein
LPEKDSIHEGRNRFFVDVDRMINEGLGGGQVTQDNGLINETTEMVKESPAREDV